MSKTPDFSYFNGKRRVGGAAAFIHYVYTIYGGITEYNEEVGEEYIKEFVKQASSAVNSNLSKSAQKKQFKKIS